MLFLSILQSLMNDIMIYYCTKSRRDESILIIQYTNWLKPLRGDIIPPNKSIAKSI